MSFITVQNFLVKIEIGSLGGSLHTRVNVVRNQTGSTRKCNAFDTKSRVSRTIILLINFCRSSSSADRTSKKNTRPTLTCAEWYGYRELKREERRACRRIKKYAETPETEEFEKLTDKASLEGST